MKPNVFIFSLVPGGQDVDLDEQKPQISIWI